MTRQVVCKDVEDDWAKNATLHHSQVHRFQTIASRDRLRPTTTIIAENQWVAMPGVSADDAGCDVGVRLIGDDVVNQGWCRAGVCRLIDDLHTALRQQGSTPDSVWPVWLEKIHVQILQQVDRFAGADDFQQLVSEFVGIVRQPAIGRSVDSPDHSRSAAGT